MENIRLLDLGTVPYLKSQSIYHCIAESMGPQTPDTIVLLAPRDPYLCVGYHQDLETRLDVDRCRELGIPIVRRQLGGGAVYLDRDQLFYQCIFSKDHAPPSVNALYEHFLAGPIEALAGLGIKATLKPPNEIEVNGKRIAGTGAGQIREATVVVGNILFDFPHDVMASVWAAPSRHFRSLARNGLASGMTTLTDELGHRPEVENVKTLLVDAYSQTLGRTISLGRLTQDEEDHLETVENKLSSPDWVHREGSLKTDALKVSARVAVREADFRINGSTHRITVRLSDGRIDELAIDPPVRKLQEAFNGWHPTDPVAAILASSEHMHPEHELLVTLREWSEEAIN